MLREEIQEIEQDLTGLAEALHRVQFYRRELQREIRILGILEENLSETEIFSVDCLDHDKNERENENKFPFDWLKLSLFLIIFILILLLFFFRKKRCKCQKSFT
jgi:hypothetical protein